MPADRPRGVSSPGRRRLLQSAAALAALPLAGCSRPVSLQATFVQPWLSHAAHTPEQWREHFQAARSLGCREIYLQWSGIDGAATNWALSDETTGAMLEAAGTLGIGVHLGMPYDERWWTVLGDPAPTALPRFLDAARERCVAHVEGSRWTAHPAFRGWYIPYELEQYNWASEARLELLVPWLSAIAAAARATAGASASISTYHSQLPTEGSLAALWARLVPQTAVRPMVQDGVGVAGMGNYRHLEPLRRLLREQDVAFDLIVELFEELPAQADGGFRARSASPGRVQRQLERAGDYGAQRIVGFALDPWVTGDTPEARTLRRALRSRHG